MRLFAITIIPNHRCAILSISILFKTTKPWAYVASSLEALVGSVVVHIQANEATYWKDLMKTEGTYPI